MDNKINTYTCEHGHVTVTIDRDKGVTPMLLMCRQKLGSHRCTSMARSAWYRCSQDLTPEYEWFKPKTLKGLSPQMREHIKRGGLELRKIKP